jgi:hypothetical protein
VVVTVSGRGGPGPFDDVGDKFLERGGVVDPEEVREDEAVARRGEQPEEVVHRDRRSRELLRSGGGLKEFLEGAFDANASSKARPVASGDSLDSAPWRSSPASSRGALLSFGMGVVVAVDTGLRGGTFQRPLALVERSG